MSDETYTVTIEPIGAEIKCRADQTVLDACLREGVWLPHACTHGTCGTCKAQVLEGDLDLGDASPYALLESERDEGAALLCVAKPRSDVTIEGEVDVDDGVEIHPVRDYAGRVVELAEVSAGVRRLRVALTSPIPFNPGQYVLLRTPDGETRPYSLAGLPGDTIELHVKRSADGLATDGWIFKDLAVGDDVSVSGPYGQFFLRPARDEPVLLLAGGTGLAPMKAILQSLASTGCSRQVVLYHGVPTVDDLYEHEWLERFAASHQWFSYRPALSRDSFDGRTGRVPVLVAEDYPRAAGHVAYLCGSPEFVADSMKALMKARLFPRDIYREDFFDSADRASGRNVVRSPLIGR
ncbi:2Fe-2S iron-sulfur cluster-binding protein [Kribbella ginsengisoli]|uniref:Phenol 2-monooxygenase domain-containing protein n=1 Tax=Kribbella ginsengisoli TaxID=363865 RepID=A0ABP6WBB1_9ACTN